MVGAGVPAGAPGTTGTEAVATKTGRRLASGAVHAAPIVVILISGLSPGMRWKDQRSTTMSFWNLSSIELSEFRPGILSRAETGSDLVMACMEIGPGKEDTGHEHPFDQGGVILQGRIEMFIGDERKTLGPNEAYFIPSGVRHGWKTFEQAARILDISAKQK